jgi:signal transduction histidine kinase
MPHQVRSVVCYVNNPSNPRSLSTNYVRALLEARDGRLWVGTWSRGLCRYDAATNDFTVFKTAMDDPRGLRSNVIRVLFEDRSGTIWAGTPDGLHRLDDQEKGVFTLFTEEDGLPNNVIYSIQEDNAGNLWLGTNKGLCRFNPRTKQARTFSVADGLQSNEFNGLASCKTRDGMMYFGGVAGLNGFHPDSIRDNQFIPPVALTEFTVYNVHVKLDIAIERTQHITVRHEDNFRIEFAALEFSKPSANRFAYTLEGLDQRWTEAGLRHEATYTKLPPGEYLFRVRAANSDGVWNMAGRTLRIIVLPPWWMSWWFRLLCAVAVVGTVAAVYRARVAYLRKQSATLQRIVKEQTHELRDANNEILRQLDMLNEQSRDIEIANTELQEKNLALDTTLKDLQVAQIQIVQSERMSAIGMLTAGVMHEINNPNAVVYSASHQALKKSAELKDFFFSLLDDDEKDTEEAETFVQTNDSITQYLSLIRDGSERVKGIVENLQGFTKHQNTTETLGDLRDAITSTVQLFGFKFNAVKVTAQMETSLEVRANFGEINQIFLNLLVNAAQAGATSIEVHASQQAQANVEASRGMALVRVEIKDNGKGMSEETQKSIFEPFFSTKGVGNSGLGLSIVKKLIEAMNGRIWCESEAEKGAMFVVELPAAITSPHPL